VDIWVKGRTISTEGKLKKDRAGGTQDALVYICIYYMYITYNIIYIFLYIHNIYIYIYT
jgi:hypothetical protein